MDLRSIVPVCLAAGLAACTVDGTDESCAESYDTETAVLAFRADWRIEQLGALVPGAAVRFDYDAERLASCRGDFNGQPGWTITGYASLNGAAPASFYVAGFSPTSAPPAPSIRLDQPGDLAVWFHNTSRWGCSAYDSNFGTNFHFQVQGDVSPLQPGAAATVRLGADGEVALEGELARGGTLRVDYAPERLEECRGEQQGYPAWTLTGYASLDGAEPTSFYVAGHSATGSVDPPLIRLERSGDLALWFHNTNRWGCSAYDSNLGANYHFTVR